MVDQPLVRHNCFIFGKRGSPLQGRAAHGTAAFGGWRFRIKHGCNIFSIQTVFKGRELRHGSGKILPLMTRCMAEAA